MEEMGGGGGWESSQIVDLTPIIAIMTFKVNAPLPGRA